MRTPRRAFDAWLVALILSVGLEGFAHADVTSYIQVRGACAEDAEDARLSVRRLKATYEEELGSDTAFLIQGIYKTGNASATDDRVYLQEALIRVRLGGGSLTLGQFKPPFGLERFTPDWDLDAIDRSVATDSLVPNGKLGRGQGFTRDYGAQWEDKSRSGRVWGAVGVFGGHGANSPWRGVSPLVAGRVLWTAHRGTGSTLRVGASASWRRADDVNLDNALPGESDLSHFSGEDGRWGLDLSLDCHRARFRAELLRVGLRPSDGAAGRVRAAGGYVQASYRVSHRLEVATKVERFDPNTALSDQWDQRQASLALTYLLHGRQDRLQLAYVRPIAASGPRSTGRLLCQFQRFF